MEVNNAILFTGKQLRESLFLIKLREGVGSIFFYIYMNMNLQLKIKKKTFTRHLGTWGDAWDKLRNC